MARINIAILPLAAAGLAACQEQPAELGDLEQPTNLGPVGFSNFVDLSDTQIAATIKPEFGFGPIQNEAKSLCTDKPVCEVIIFEEGTTLPNALPLTDREEDSTIAMYELNRAEGSDEMIARCPTVPRTPQDSCMDS